MHTSPRRTSGSGPARPPLKLTPIRLCPRYFTCTPPLISTSNANGWRISASPPMEPSIFQLPDLIEALKVAPNWIVFEVTAM